jgi:hypothetical protein
MNMKIAIFVSLLAASSWASAGTIEDNIQRSAHQTPPALRSLCGQKLVRPESVRPINTLQTGAVEIPVALPYKLAKIAAGSRAPDLQKCEG